MWARILKELRRRKRKRLSIVVQGFNNIFSLKLIYREPLDLECWFKRGCNLYVSGYLNIWLKCIYKIKINNDKSSPIAFIFSDIQGAYIINLCFKYEACIFIMSDTASKPKSNFHVLSFCNVIVCGWQMPGVRWDVNTLPDSLIYISYCYVTWWHSTFETP